MSGSESTYPSLTTSSNSYWVSLDNDVGGVNVGLDVSAPVRGTAPGPVQLYVYSVSLELPLPFKVIIFKT